MSEYQKNTATVISRLRERNYSGASIQHYEKIFSSISIYLDSKGVVYSPELGEEMLQKNDDTFFTVKGNAVRAACIHKLNDVYLHGDISGTVLAPHRIYRKIRLVPEFEEALSEFIEHAGRHFTEIQLKNVERRVSLFFKCMQHWGVYTLDEITYEKIYAYHGELAHLKPVSKVVEESSIHQMLHFLSDQGRIDPGRYLCMYLLEKGHSFLLESFTEDEQNRIEGYRHESLCLTPDMFLNEGNRLILKYHDTGYADIVCDTAKRTILYLYLFLDLNNLGYLPEIADLWLNSDVTKEVITGSCWKMAHRVLNVFCDMICRGEPSFYRVYRRGISGLEELPDWCKVPLIDYALLREKEKLEESTVKNDIYSVLRFLRFILEAGCQSFSELTGEDIIEFNLKDIHGSLEGKNSCNARIRNFLKYLGREGYVPVQNLYMSLSPTAASPENVVRIFTDDEILTVRKYIDDAKTPLEIRDSAIMLLGCDMGVRGCDIAALKISDIDWRKQCIRFRQDKTDVDVYLAMPTAVGNAIFRYLRDVRNRKTGSDHVFIGINAPYRPITRSVCYETLRRILPGRKVPGSGFHVTRKTFSTNRLRNGVKPALIADALGQVDTLSLTPYLSLDSERMTACPLSLSDLLIPMKGGF